MIVRRNGGMSPSRIRAPPASPPTAAIPAFSELASPEAKSGLCAKPTSRPSRAALIRLGLVPGHHHDAGRAGSRALARPSGESAACRRTAPSACSARPCGSSDRRQARRPAPWPGARSRIDIARLRPGRDFHQQARRRPSPAMSPPVTSSPAISRSSTQSKPFSLGLRAQPGAPMHRRLPDPPEHQQIAGIDRHAGARHLAAGQLDRRGDHVARSRTSRTRRTPRPCRCARQAPASASARAAASWGTRTSSPIVLPDRASRLAT